MIFQYQAAPWIFSHRKQKKIVWFFSWKKTHIKTIFPAALLSMCRQILMDIPWNWLQLNLSAGALYILNTRKHLLLIAGWGDLLKAVRRLTLRWKLQILSYFYSFQSFQSIFGLYMMKQYVVKLRKLFPQFYTVFFVFDVTPW